MLVDDAAIPASLLARWLAFAIAFATTVHGYEGQRGFALRFRDILDRQAPQWRELTLQAPIRWSAGDPLEASFSTCFYSMRRCQKESHTRASSLAW